MKVNADSPEILHFERADLFHVWGRPWKCVRVGEHALLSPGSLAVACFEMVSGVNPGDPRDSSVGEYWRTSLEKRGRREGRVGVGPIRSTRSAGKPRTGGRGGSKDTFVSTFGSQGTRRPL